MAKEKIKIEDFIEEIKKVDKNFASECERLSTVKNAVSSVLLGYFEWGSVDFGWGRIDLIEEQEEGYQEETVTGIFERVEDGKCFSLWMHDAGEIGPSTLTMCEFLEEVEPKKETITKWE